MGGESSGSFIPKQNPVKRSRKRVSRQVYLFTIISYVSLFAAVIAAVGVFFYSSYTDRLLDDEIAALDSEINFFDESKMFDVLEFENRLQTANHHFNHTASIHSLLEAVEESTVATVQIDTFSVTRIADEQYTVETMMLADTFDSTIFQRGVLERNDRIAAVEVMNVTSEASLSEGSESGSAIQTSVNESPDSVAFNATLSFDVDSLPVIVEPRNTDNMILLDTASPEEDVRTEAGTSTGEAAGEVTNSNI